MASLTAWKFPTPDGADNALQTCVEEEHNSGMATSA